MNSHKLDYEDMANQVGPLFATEHKAKIFNFFAKFFYFVGSNKCCNVLPEMLYNSCHKPPASTWFVIFYHEDEIE